MPRNKTVTLNGKDIIVQEKRIKELESLIKELFPESKGKIAEIDLGKFMESADFNLLYKTLPKLIPGLTAEDVKDAYMSELEELLGAFVDVNFFGLKQLIQPLLKMAQSGLQQKL